MADSVECPRCRTSNKVEGMLVTGNVFKETGQGITKMEGWDYQLATKYYPLITVIKCNVCGDPFVAVGNVDEAGPAIVWPLPGIDVPEGVPVPVAEAYSDAMRCLAVGGRIGALLAARRALERMLRDKGVSRFKDLADSGVITAALYGAADQVRLWADDFAHEDVLAESATVTEVQEVMDHFKLVLETVYTHQLAVDRMKTTKKARKGKTDSGP